MTTINLTMMVKNEAGVIERCLRSALPFIDSWTILDTGSTDGTQDIIRDVLAGVPGELHDGEFVNFGVTRSELFGHASACVACGHDRRDHHVREAPSRCWFGHPGDPESECGCRLYAASDYLLLLDADMQIDHDGPFPELTADVYEGTLRLSTIDYTLPILVRNDREWRYEGVAHSYLACDGPWAPMRMPGLKIIDGSHTGPDKLRRDLDLLSAEHARDPLDARTAFYLAQTYYDLGMIPQAIALYRARAYMTNGWDEETYYASYRLGCLLCEHVSFSEGADELLRAWRMRPSRVEALRALANVGNNVADKAALPPDRLFVHHAAYLPPKTIAPLYPLIEPTRRRQPRRTMNRGLRKTEVSAIIVTRGNVDLEPILSTLPYTDVIVWNNAEREHDYKVFGRYAAIPEVKNPVIYWQDDDVVFTAHDELLAAYEPGLLVSNMDDSWIDACGYRDLVAMQGAGSLCDSDIPAKVFARYLSEHPFDDDFLIEADFAFGVLAPFKVVDLGYETRPFADDDDRLYRQPWQQERKWAMIRRCLGEREADA